jgi:hypothetical protein
VPLPAEAADEAILVDGEAVETIRHVELINNAGSYLSAEGHGGDYGFIAPDDGGFDQAADRFAVSGAAMMARRETFARLGLFATPFFAYYEDLDWCWRAQLAGMRVRYEPQSIVRHVGGVSTGGPLSSRVRFLAARNRMHTLARNAPLHVLWWQLRRPPPEFPPAGLDRALATRLPRGLLERRRLARRWKRSPAEVWSQWAGVGEGWSVTE